MNDKLTRIAIAIVATVTVLALAPPASAQGAGLYSWAGQTPQGGWLELTGTLGGGGLAVNEVRLSKAVVKCAKGLETLDLGSLVFDADAFIGAAPFTVARVISDDSQVALLVKGQHVSQFELSAKLTVYWTHLFYGVPTAELPSFERCSTQVPVTLQLYAID